MPEKVTMLLTDKIAIWRTICSDGCGLNSRFCKTDSLDSVIVPSQA